MAREGLGKIPIRIRIRNHDHFLCVCGCGEMGCGDWVGERREGGRQGLVIWDYPCPDPDPDQAQLGQEGGRGVVMAYNDVFWTGDFVIRHLCTGLQDQVDCDLNPSSILRELLVTSILEILNSLFLHLLCLFGIHMHFLTMSLKFLIPFFPVFREIAIDMRLRQGFSFHSFLFWHHAALHEMISPSFACFLSTLLLITLVHLVLVFSLLQVFSSLLCLCLT